MKCNCLLAAIFATIAMTAPGQAAKANTVFNGNDLLLLCESKDDFEQGRCFGFIDGVARQSYATNRGKSGPESSCIPASAQQGQIKEVITNFLHSYPQLRTGPAELLITEALAQAFPCDLATKRTKK